MGSWLDKFIGHVIKAAGTVVAQRQYLNFIGATVADNPTADTTDVTFANLPPVVVSKAVTTADLVLTPTESVADFIELTGAPAASHNVTMDGAATRPKGVLLRVANQSTKKHTFFDGNGNGFDVVSGEVIVFEWSDGVSPTLTEVSRTTVGGAFVFGTPVVGAVPVAISATAAAWGFPFYAAATVHIAAGVASVASQGPSTLGTITISRTAAGHTVLTLPNTTPITGRVQVTTIGTGGHSPSVVQTGDHVWDVYTFDPVLGALADCDYYVQWLPLV